MSSASSDLNSFKYRSDIDGLRALAISLVIGFHAFPEEIKGGFIGVDIFFVISGFLISTIILKGLDKNNFSFIEFYARRIRRILPALITVLIFCCISCYFFLLPTEIKQLSKHIMGGVGFVSNFILWKESGYFDSSVYTKPLLHLWSLSIEWQFYMLWPVTLYACSKRNINLFFVTIILFIISFILNIKGVKTNNIQTFYLPMTRFWELLGGSLLAWGLLYEKKLSQTLSVIDQMLGKILYNVPPTADGKTLKNTKSSLGCLLIVAGLLCIKKTHFPGWSALMPVLGTVLIIAAGRQAWINNVILSNRFLVWLGLISYPLFLWHWPLLSFAWMMHDDSAPSITLRLTLILISVILSWVTYQFIEKPMRFTETSTSNKKTLILVFVFGLLGCLGYYVYEKNGCVFKEPLIVQELSQYVYDNKSAYREGTCFLRPEQSYGDFKKCDDSIQKDKKTIILWGDSFTAHLYPGYKKYFGKNFNVVQRSLSSAAGLK